MTSTEPVGSDPAPRPRRRTFASEYKLRIVAEYDAAPRNEKGAVLRRYGLGWSGWWARQRRAPAALEVLGDASALLEMISESAD